MLLDFKNFLFIFVMLMGVLPILCVWGLTFGKGAIEPPSFFVGFLTSFSVKHPKNFNKTS